MVPGHPSQVERHARLRRPPEDVLAGQERDLALSPDHSKGRGRRPRLRGLGRDRAEEGVAEAVDGAHQPRPLGVVPDGGSDLGRQPRQARVRDEGIGPELVVDLLLRHRPRPAPEEEIEELEGLRREVLGRAVPHELVAARVEDALAEADRHGARILTRAGGAAAGGTPPAPNIAIPEGFAKDIDRAEDYHSDRRRKEAT